MVDAVVSLVVQKVTDYLDQEVSFLRGVKNEVEWLKRELQLMLSFIEDAEEKGDNNHLIRQWVSQVRDIAYDTEYVLDEYMVKFHEEGALDAVKSIDAGEASQRQPGCLAFGRKCPFQQCKKKFNFFRKGRDLHGIGKEIEGLKERINELSRQRQTYGLQDIGSNNRGESNNARIINLREQRRTTPLRAERNVVGLVNEVNELLGKLVDDDKDPSRLIISIWGMGGLGKTALAGKLYRNERVQKRFKCRAWVCVSQEYNMRDLLEIAKSFKIGHAEELGKMSQRELEESLHQFLNDQHSYLLVIDDLWDQVAWRKLQAAFPDNHNGSRVIVTTRIKEIAVGLDRSTKPHELRRLDPDESLELFCEEAYGNKIPSLMDWENKMVEICRGLPLAIVVLAGFFRANENSQQRHKAWERLKKDDDVDGLLSLGFNDLSRHQKLCFLYLGLFPEDFSIRAEQVIRLWVAEGLIEQDDRLIFEDVARGYLNELANRSLIQVEQTEYCRIISFRLHDLLRELAIQKGKDIDFVHVDNNNTNPAHSSTSCLTPGCL